jgi:hypothetical protein
MAPSFLLAAATLNSLAWGPHAAGWQQQGGQGFRLLRRRPRHRAQARLFVLASQPCTLLLLVCLADLVPRTCLSGTTPGQSRSGHHRSCQPAQQTAAAGPGIRARNVTGGSEDAWRHAVGGSAATPGPDPGLQVCASCCHLPHAARQTALAWRAWLPHLLLLCCPLPGWRRRVALERRRRVCFQPASDRQQRRELVLAHADALEQPRGRGAREARWWA